MEFSKGNEKIGLDTLIFNMTRAYDCPSDKLNFCNIDDKCYAKKAETQYHHCVPAFRERQHIEWLTETPKQIFLDIKSKVENARVHFIDYVRFNESGDFEGQWAVNKLISVCNLLASDSATQHIVVYGYTNRHDLDFSTIPSNLIINGTNFMVSNEFIPIDGGKLSRYSNMCKGMVHKKTGGCQGCNLCKESKGQVIYTAIH